MDATGRLATTALSAAPARAFAPDAPPEFCQDVPVSPYLKQNYAPIFEEMYAEDLQVLSGSIPAALDGEYVRNGPNPQFDLRGKPYFWFDGDGMVHGIRLRNGRASYINRWIRTQRFVADDKRGFTTSDLAQMALGSFDSLSLSVDDAGEHMGRGNTALILHNKKAYALEESDKCARIGCPH